MEMISAFSDVLHIPNLRQGQQIYSVLEQSGLLDSTGLARIKSALGDRRANIGVKKLLDLIDMIRQTRETDRPDKLIAKLEMEGLVEMRE